MSQACKLRVVCLFVFSLTHAQVAEAFPWVSGRSQFAYLDQSHNSVLGMRAKGCVSFP